MFFFMFDGTEEEPILPPEVERPARGRAIVTGWTNNDRFIGCCPPGDQNGRPYRSGMACCVEELYNATMEFCCLSKAMWVAPWRIAIKKNPFQP